MSTNAIRVQQLVARYGDQTVLNGIDFAIPAGQIFGLLGPNGAGKTTCLKVLLGHKQPDAGQVLVLDQCPHTAGPAWRNCISWLGDQNGLYARQSARYNLELYAQLYGAPITQVMELATAFQLQDLLDKSVNQLSKGQKQRLALARALMHQPQILFLDEPTTGLDLQSARDLRQSIVRCAEFGTTVVLTTHDLEEAEELCHQVAFLVDGKIAASGSPAELCLSVLGQQLIPLDERVGLKRVFWQLTSGEGSPGPRQSPS